MRPWMSLSESIHEAIAKGESCYPLVPEMMPFHERMLCGLVGFVAWLLRPRAAIEEQEQELTCGYIRPGEYWCHCDTHLECLIEEQTDG